MSRKTLDRRYHELNDRAHPLRQEVMGSPSHSMRPNLLKIGRFNPPARKGRAKKIPDAPIDSSPRGLLGRIKQFKSLSESSRSINSEDPLLKPKVERRPSLGSDGNSRSRRSSLERRPSMDELTLHQTMRSIGESALPPPPPPPIAPIQSEPAIKSRGLGKKPIHEMVRRRKASPLPNTPPTIMHPLVVSILDALKKDHMLDLTLTGKDGVRVKTSRYVMACRIESLEAKLYDSETKTECVLNELPLGDYSETVLKALVEYCFAGEIIKSPLKKEENEETARGLVQLSQLASALQFRPLRDETYQMARRLMNRHLPLACAVYDEAIAASAREFETYALQTIADCPKEALLVDEDRNGIGIRYLSPLRLETLLNNPEMEVEPMQVIWMLLRWVEKMERSEESVEVAKRVVQNVQLKYIDRIDLLTTVKQSGFVDMTDIENALAEQEKEGSALIKKHDHLEKVVVKGAGLDFVNGLYFREKDRDNEAMYAKGEGNNTISLHRWGMTWGIAPVSDQSNLYYTCEVNFDSDQAPFLGWRVGPNGKFPAPTCTWVAAADSDDEEDDSLLPLSSTEGVKSVPACFQSEEELYGN